MPHSHFPFCLSVDALEIPVHLGVTEEERETAQTVLASVKLFYPALPEGAKRDREAYLCYDDLCQALLRTAAAKPMHLLEFLTAELFQSVRRLAPRDVHVWVKIRKPLPRALVGYAVDSASAEYTDLPSGVLP